MDSIKKLEQYVDASIAFFMQRMDEFQGKEMDMGKWLQLFAFGTRQQIVSKMSEC